MASQILPHKNPGLFRKIDIGEYDFYSPNIIGMGYIQKVDELNRKMFITHNPDIPTPTEEQVNAWVDKMLESGTRLALELLMVFAEVLLIPGTHGKTVRDVADFVSVPLVLELSDFFMKSAFGKVNGYEEYKKTSKTAGALLEEAASSTTNTSPKRGGRTSTNTSPRKANRT
jgi:hypothetical protein